LNCTDTAAFRSIGHEHRYNNAVSYPTPLTDEMRAMIERIQWADIRLYGSILAHRAYLRRPTSTLND